MGTRVPIIRSILALVISVTTSLAAMPQLRCGCASGHGVGSPLGVPGALQSCCCGDSHAAAPCPVHQQPVPAAGPSCCHAPQDEVAGGPALAAPTCHKVLAATAPFVSAAGEGPHQDQGPAAFDLPARDLPFAVVSAALAGPLPGEAVHGPCPLPDLVTALQRLTT